MKSLYSRLPTSLGKLGGDIESPKLAAAELLTCHESRNYQFTGYFSTKPIFEETRIPSEVFMGVCFNFSFCVTILITLPAFANIFLITTHSSRPLQLINFFINLHL